MRHIQDFETYLETGTVKKQSKDPQKAKSLFENSNESYEMLHVFIKSVGISDKTANHIVKNAYDSIMERIRAKMAQEGYNACGNGAHEAEVSYMRKLGFRETEIDLADSLRYFRNGILYYGKKTDAQFAQKIIILLDQVRTKLPP